MEYVSDKELYRAYRKHPVVRIDSRSVQPGDLFFGLAGTRVHGNAHAAGALDKGAAYAVVDDESVIPDNDNRYLYVEDTLAALQGLAVSHRLARKMPVLAITGSNGKTTTKELVAAVMSRRYAIHATPGNYNNHIGVPLTILSAPKQTEMMILEMGANHQGEIGELCSIGQPTHGLITNIGQAHLEGFGGIEGVIAGKGELFDYLSTTRGVAFVNADEQYLLEMAADNTRVVTYVESDRPSREVAAIEIRVHRVHPSIKVGYLDGAGEEVTTVIQLNGRHNLQNVKAAITVGKYFKVPAADIAAGLAAYRSANHRSQYLLERGVRFYWDAYNANPSSVVAALDAFAEDHARRDAVIILGEMLELGDASVAAHHDVVAHARRLAETIVLVGPAMEASAVKYGCPWFVDSQELSDWFWGLSWQDRTIFVKGSRGNRLERMLAEHNV